MEWINSIVGGLGLLIALVAIWQTQRGNRLAKDANAVAERALKMQEDDAQVRLVVSPKMLLIIGDGDDKRPRPVVTVINLSAFPVTIEQIWWSTGSADGKGFFWKNPPLSSPFSTFPARLESRQAVTAIGLPWKNEDDLLSVTAAVAVTQCGERVEGMTDQWREHCEELRRERGRTPVAPSPEAQAGTDTARSSGSRR